MIDHWKGKPAFASRGFYLHACWQYRYPFAVRTWKLADYQNMFPFLRSLNFDRVMLWPMLEIAPAPLSSEDKNHIADLHHVIECAKANQLECWIVSSPNLSVTDEIRKIPIQQRHFYPYKKIFRFDDILQYNSFVEHLENLLSILNNANGYVFIDGDPGGYPGAKPDDFIKLFHSVRDILNRLGTDPENQKIIPWIWCGWGADWEKEGPWKPDLSLYVPPVLRAFKENPPPEPWELLPGRSTAENWANGRKNFIFTENEGLIERSTLMLYEIIEYEPSPPAVTLQFNRIRRVFRDEIKYANQARGVFGNGQTPILSLPNLYYFARIAWNPEAIDIPDQQILRDFANFLGGDPEILVPAWSCLSYDDVSIPDDLPIMLRNAELTSEPAQYIPGSPRRYLDILSDMVKTRLSVLHQCSEKPVTPKDTVNRIANSIQALVDWWNVHQYVFSGETKNTFDWSFTSPFLLRPLVNFINENRPFDNDIIRDTTRYLKDNAILPEHEIEPLLRPLFNGEVNAWFPE